MLPMEVMVNLPADQVYDALVDYIETRPFDKNAKVASSSKPAYVKIKRPGFWPWKSANIHIYSQHDECRIVIDIDFSLFLALCLGMTFVSLTMLGIGFSRGADLVEVTLGGLVITGSMFAEIIHMRNMFKNKISTFLSGIEPTRKA